ncbi:glycosyltransferase family 10 domain-containing protein [Pseudooceanicola sp.]|uniref:glycosyltransferase family 10 domain-containing protein n=1 Tax=Pseudooceanicola sp. TaxID=1914328 RepID=UPI0035C6A6DE
MTSDPAIAILPYGRLFGAGYLGIGCDDLHWPLGQPDRLRGKTLRDMQRTDHLIVYPRPALHLRPLFGLKARLSMMVQEPRVIHNDHRRLLRVTHRRFFRVLTHDRALIGRIPNGVFVPFGTTWVPEWRDLDLTKSRSCSLIASAKRSQEGHRVRHAIADHIRDSGLDVDVMGGGYAPFEAKSDGLAPYRYSVVIENAREPDYFTEKLIDAILCLSVPIYWGCPNIAEYFDPAPFVICETEAEIMAAMDQMSDADYAARLPGLQALRDQAARYGDLHLRTAEALRDSL